MNHLERMQRMMAWNQTAEEFPQVCLHQLFEHQAKQRPNQTAVIDETGRLTYRELDERANQFAHYLRELGVGPEVRVGVFMNRSLDMVVSLLGILKAGGAYLPLDLEAPSARIRQILQDAQALLCVARSESKSSLPEHEVRTVFIDDLRETLAKLPLHPPESGVLPDNLVSVFYTSGSTGRPKGVALHHKGWVNKMVSQQRLIDLQPGETVLQKTTLTFDDSVVELFCTLHAGGRIALLEPGLHRDPEAILDALARYEVGFMMIVPSMLNRILDVADHTTRTSLGKLRHVSAGGESLTADMVRRFYEKLPGKLHNTWGATEVSVDSTIHTCSEADYDETGAVCVGKPMPNNRVYVLDADLNPVDIGFTGDLYLAGVGVARGYVNDPERTERSFMDDPFVPGERMYRTGDQGYFRPDGSIKFLGRIDHVVKLRGIRVGLGEIEETLLQHQQVKEAAVLMREDVPGVKRLVAYVVLRNDQNCTKQELRSFLKEYLPLYMVPHSIEILDKFPLNQNLKLDRHALPAPSTNRPDLETAYVQPSTAMEMHLCGLFAEVLRLDVVGVHDDFFDLGGDSITATQVMTRLRASVDSNLALKVLFEHKSVASLAANFEATGRTVLEDKPSGIRRISREQDLPLSYAQERLWFIQQMDPGSSTYNEPVAFRIRGAVQADTLQTALNEVVKRHEPLRTYFMVINDQPVQRAATDLFVELPIIDLTHVPVEDREEALHATMTEDSRVPFDFGRAPFMRAALLRLGEDEHVFYVNMHHIITDAWSGVVFLEELGMIYDALLKKKAHTLDELPFQYADFSVWQREWLASGVMQDQMNFWKQELAGELPVLQLPTDFPRPSLQTFAGDRLYFALDAELVAKIESLGQANDVSLYMVLLAAYNILLHRYSRQNDILVGSPIANRTVAGLERMIGFFVNTIVIRSEFAGGLSFAEYLQQVRERCLNVYNHQEVPFDQLVRELQVDRSLAYAPLVQAVFAFQNKLEETLALSDLQVSTVDVNAKNARFDLSLYLTETQSGHLAGILEFNTDLFKRETVERLRDNFITLLNGIVTDATQDIAKLPLPDDRQPAVMQGWSGSVGELDNTVGQPPILTADEREKIMVAWNDTAKPYPAHLTIQELFEAQVERDPDALALEFAGRQMTYGELNRKANRLARTLRSRGVGAETIVSLLAMPSLEMIIGMLGIVKAGGAYLPIDPATPLDRIRILLNDSGTEWVLTCTEHPLDLEFAGSVHDLTCQDLYAEDDSNLPLINRPEHLLVLLYTSGTTGMPKGVLLEHRNMVSFADMFIDKFQMGPSDRVLQQATIAFDNSIEEILVALLSGASLFIVRKYEFLDMIYMPEFIRTKGITVICTTPLMVNELNQHLHGHDHQLRLITTGGDVLKSSYFSRLQGVEVYNTYGPTEASVFSTAYHCQGEEGEGGRVPIGRPVSNEQVWILDRDGNPTPIGVIGELYIAGAGVARGYLNRPELTAEKFVDNPFAPGTKMYRTGDMVRWLANGNIEFIGRADHLVKIRGFRVEPGEIESNLMLHDNVKEAIVIAYEDPSVGKYLVAYLVLDGAGAGEAELREFLKDRLPDYMIPSAFVVMDKIILNQNGKVDRKKLPKPELNRSGDEHIPPRTLTEQGVADIWAQALGMDRVGVQDNFFRLGGHSLLVTQVTFRLREAFGIDIPVRTLFESPTLADLAERIDVLAKDKQESSSPAIKRVQRVAKKL